MILIGQYDSPFVRRVAVALTLYGFAYEHRPWSVFGDADKIAAINPLRRVPTLVADDGEALLESSAMLDWLDDLVAPEARLIAPTGLQRRQSLKVQALATGLADKAVNLVYERAIHDRSTPMWLERCRGQIAAVLEALEADRAARTSDWWFGPRIDHADIAVGCAVQFVREAHPDAFDATAWPALAAHADRCEALPAFQGASKPFFMTPPPAD